MNSKPSHGERVIARQAGVGRRTVWISILTLLSRILGLVREVVSAALFGDKSVVYDAFLFAWRIPNLFRRFLGEGALSTSLQASLTKADAEHGDARGRALFGATLVLLAKALVALCVVVIALLWMMPDHMPGTDFAWLGPEPALVREFTMRLMPFVVFVCLTAAMGGALNVRGHYTLPALGPVMLNTLWIGTLFGITWVWRGSDTATLEQQLPLVRWLAAGVLAAGLAQLAILLPSLRKYGLWTAAKPNEAERVIARTGARDVLRKSAPLALGAAVYQVNVMIDGLMAQSLLAPGGQTVHYLANRVQQFPLALVAIAATTAVFPALAAFGQQRRLDDLRALHDTTQRNVLFVALPATFGLAALAYPVTSMLFEYGSFSAAGVERTADALRVLAFAILPAGAVGLVARTYYSVGDYKTPVRISSAMLLANVGLNLVFLRGFDMDADGLALATTITSFGNLLLLMPGLRTRLGLPRALPGLLSTVARMLIAGISCGAVARSVAAWGQGSSLAGLWLVAAIFAGVATYTTVAWLLRVPECAYFVARFKRISGKIGKKS